MGQLDGVTPQRLENQVRDAQATIASERPSGEVLSPTLANADVAVQVSDFQGRLTQAFRSHDTLVAQLNQAVQALDGAKQNWAAAATAAAQHFAQQETELAAAKAETATLRESLVRQLATAYDRTADAEAAAERLTRRETELAEAVEAHQNLERRFSAALVLLQEQDADLEATTERLTRREAELAEATETRLSLERQLAEAESARGEAVRRSADDRSTAIQQAAQRQSEFEAVLREEVAKYDTLAHDLLTTRQELAHADTTLQEAEARAHTALQAADERAAAERLDARQRAAERDAEFVARLDQAAATRERLEQALTVARDKVAETETAIRAADDRHASHIATVTARFADQQVQYETRLAEAAAARNLVDQRLREVEVSFERSRQEGAVDAAAAAERLTRLEAQRVEAHAHLQMLEEQLADANAALYVAEHCRASERLAAERQAAQRQAAFEAEIARETAGRHAVEQDLATSQQKLAESESALLNAEQRHASEMKTAAGHFAERQREFETLLAQTTAVKDASDVRLREAEATLERIHDERRAEAIAVAEQLTQLESNLAKATELVASERVASAKRATERQMEFDARLSLELGTRNTIEQTLAATRQNLLQTEAALRDATAQHTKEMTDADQRHASALKAAATQLTEQQMKYESGLAEITNALHTAEERVVSERAASAERATERQMEFDAKLSLELGTRNTIEQALAATRQSLLQTEAALRDATAQHTKEMTSASNELSEQHSQFTTRLAQASAAHAALEQKIADADQRHASALKAAATQLAEQQMKYETRLAEITTAREIVSKQLHDTETTLARIRRESDANAVASTERLSQRESELAAASAARQLLEGRLVDTETALKHSEARALAERTAAMQQSAQRRAEFDAQLAREVEARNVVERDLAENRLAAEQSRQALLGQSAALTGQMRELELRLTQELARERADYESKLADANQSFERIRQAKEVEREALRQSLDQVRAEALATLKRVESEHTAELAKLENELRAAVTAHRQQVEQMQSGLKAVMQDVEASRAESQRQFEGSPIGILRCSEAGVLKEANRALITALGYRTVDQLRALGSAASVFESPDDLRWLIEHCEPTPSESVDCIWKKKDGSRLMMRLRALRLSADVVHIVAEDVTTLRAVEERLRQAQRMEAVGRLASEVADTCDILLRNVSQDGQQWLATVGSNAAQRHQGELILAEVTRAASFLRQLSVYGEKQTSALAEVDVNTVLRDLAPVLKRVAGDDIELVLPKKVLALNVDVDAERVERVLVNIAAYGRARMPSGGRLIVELARVVVDLDFVTKYPNVRHGAHALISVTEVRTAAPAEWPTGTREAVEANATKATSERPGVDLGALQRLIGDCGGHLWMKAEPGGDMEVKIHFPLRSADTSTSGVVRSALARSVGTWFQS